MSQLNIVGIAGSIRTQSFSKIVLAAISHMLPAGTTFSTIDIGAMPHFNEDMEQTALPASVVSGRQAVAGCDAVVIVVPEFNHGIPGVLKNTLDWLSRPAFTSCAMNKPVFFVTLSPGALGGVRAQYQMRETLASMLCVLVPLPEIAITFVGKKIADGRLADQMTLDFIAHSLQQFMQRADLIACHA
jgi:chromate reductase